MKLKLLLFLFLLTGAFYLMQTLELDSNERKQNYEKETHSFIASVKSTVDFSFHSPNIFDIHFAFNGFTFQCSFHLQPLQFCFLKEPSPPDKIYLQHLSLLI